MRALGVGVGLALALASLAGCSGPAAPTDPAASPAASEAAPADATLRAAFDGDIAVSAGSGARPALTWPEVEGAALYRVTIVQADGPAWAWSGMEPTVVPGGGAAGREGPGFALTSPATAYVAAFDAEGGVLDTGLGELPGP